MQTIGVPKMEGLVSAFSDWTHLPPLVLNLISEKVKSIIDYVRFRAVFPPWRSAFPDWAHLPSLVLHLISEKVKFITDYVRFRAVCSLWRSATLAKPRHLPFQLPWLMIPYSIRHTYDDAGIRLFYDLWDDKMHKIPLPETVGKLCCASYRGWLLIGATDRTELFLLNPLTRTRIELPLFTNPILRAGRDSNYHGYWFESYVDDFAVAKMTFSADLTDPNCRIMVFLLRSQGIYFCKVGDSCWTNAFPHPVLNLGLRDAAYNNGKLFLLNHEAMFIYDLNQQRVQDRYFFEPELQHVPKFFLEGKSGLYVVVEGFYIVADELLGPKIVLYHVQEQPMEVKRVADTSDTTIFNEDNNRCLAVCAEDWDSLHGGCMYRECLHYVPPAGYDGGRYCYNISFARLDGGKLEPVVQGLGELPTCPPGTAMWFQPSFV